MRFPQFILATACASMLASQGTTLAQETKAGASDVAVTVTYKGAGTVDREHEIWVFLFDTPDLGAGSRPIATMALDKSGATATFKEVQTSPVFVAVAFDERGNYDGKLGPPPPGTPVAAYRIKDAKTSSPVKPGESIKISFDDSTRMQ